MRLAAKGFSYVMGTEGTEGVAYPADERARLEAGFTPQEVSLAVELAQGATLAHRGDGGS
jgi:hypothetical protein